MIESITTAAAALHSIHTTITFSIVVHSLVADVMTGDFFNCVVLAATAAGFSVTDHY